MHKSLIDILVSPHSHEKLTLKAETTTNNHIVSGNLVDKQGNNYPIVNYIPRFVLGIDNTISSFSYKWKTFAKNSFAKQEQNIELFLEYLGWNSKQFYDFLSQKTRILDAGCGTGYLSNWLCNESKAQVFGIDISTSIEEAQNNFGANENDRLHYIQADLGNTPFEKNSFDLVICKEVIHHTSEPRKNFSHLVDLLSSGGHIFIYVYKKKGPIREFCDDFLRSYTTKLSVYECHEFAKKMTKLGKSLRENNTTIIIPEDIPYLDIKAGRYDLQRFIYWNIMKCWWDDKGDVDYSDAVNFDWYHPPHAFRYTEEEIKQWFLDCNLEIQNLKILDAGIAILGKKQ